MRCQVDSLFTNAGGRPGSPAPQADPRRLPFTQHTHLHGSVEQAAHRVGDATMPRPRSADGPQSQWWPEVSPVLLAPAAAFGRQPAGTDTVSQFNWLSRHQQLQGRQHSHQRQGKGGSALLVGAEVQRKPPLPAWHPAWECWTQGSAWNQGIQLEGVGRRQAAAGDKPPSRWPTHPRQLPSWLRWAKDVSLPPPKSTQHV